MQLESTSRPPHYHHPLRGLKEVSCCEDVVNVRLPVAAYERGGEVPVSADAAHAPSLKERSECSAAWG
eukprot:7390962-Pyramimonas_sp.AAC.1